MTSFAGWKFWVDVGGTFTDGYCLSPSGEERTAKVLSSSTHKLSWPTAGIDPSAQSVQITSLQGCGKQFWTGYQLSIIDANGRILEQYPVTDYEEQHGILRWSSPLSSNTLHHAFAMEIVSPEPAPIFLIRYVLRANLQTQLNGIDLSLGTTRGTNALLTRNGARVGLLVSQGFRDLLLIGEQERPRLFDLEISKPQPLYAAVAEARERVLDDGTVDCGLDQDAVRSQLKTWRDQGIQSVAICLIHGYRYPAHELAIAAVAREVGFSEISCSHQVAPVIKLVARCETTVLDAYLNAVIRDYAAQIETSLGENSRLLLMTSSGGLVPRDRFTGKDCVLSGPAGGVVGFARAAEAAGFQRAIGFDMGGTSTDVARFDGQFEREFETKKAGIRILTPVMAIETVAAGGGSICEFDGRRLTVGPASATADPGPACYGRGGPLAITDLNFFLGRLAPDQFPFPLHRQPVQERLLAIRQQVAAATGREFTDVELAHGFLEIANQQMALAMRTVSVAKGYDPREYVMVAFGGAGPQHALAVAELLQIRQVLIHPLASILSAYGIRRADRSAHAVRSLLLRLADSPDLAVKLAKEEIHGEIESALRPWCASGDRIELKYSVDLRFVGTEPTLNVPLNESDFGVSDFHQLHQQWYGYVPDLAIELVNVRGEAHIVEQAATNVPAMNATASHTSDNTRLQLDQGNPPPSALSSATQSSATQSSATQGAADQASGQSLTQAMALHGELRNVSVYHWQHCCVGQVIDGPALISDRLTTIVVEPAWSARLLPGRQWLMTYNPLTRPISLDRHTGSSEIDPILLEVFNHQFVSIARQMGVTLQRTAISVNIKDRLDFSCALFTGAGDLVVNAPHIPVHLGAMSETVRAVIRNNPLVERGDVFVTNDPFQGGSHLPDVTVVTPVFDGPGRRVEFWVANRGHHAEIGGRTPGSMPPDAICLADEGVLLGNLKVVARGIPQFAELTELLSTGLWPSRCVGDNLADIRAQIAANQTGLLALQRLVESYSSDVVHRYMYGLLDLAETQVREAIAALPAGKQSFVDRMDNGLQIQIAIEKLGSDLIVDFTGTSPVASDNLNANRAICLAAIMYCLRCLIQSDVPLNQGIVRPLQLRLPECFLNPKPGKSAAESPAMVGGNVETSQRVVDVFLAALGRAAASQGTMNNWLMGDSSFGYYETVGGGAGATPFAAGAEAVHTHMTNTRLTDPEVLEHKYPCILRNLAIRMGSGGHGKHSGGNGMIREVEFRRKLTVSLLTSRRSLPPFGLAGGESGQCGKNLWYRMASERWETLPSRIALDVERGDRLRLETPGGGGWGN